jgi:hypothetical protein
MRKETPWGTWDHLSLEETLALFRGLAVPWWVAGGYAIDAFAGGRRREHDDIDISLFASDQLAARDHLEGWELHAADPPGALRPWSETGELPRHVHDIWARGGPDDRWRFQLMLNPGGPSALVYRRDARVTQPIEEATFLREGVRYLSPEWQLLFKSKTPRPKDERDFADCLPMLSAKQRTWLADALRLTDPANPWLARL